MGAQTPSLVDLILSGDQDALAGYYDGRAPSVYAYCAEICRNEHTEEAVLASFTDFLGRVHIAGAEADLDDLLRESTRTAAASRMRVTNSRDATCRSMPELIAARANGELPYDEGPIRAHLERCRSCRKTAQLLIEAEDALVRPASRQPPEGVRTAWLLIASREASATEYAATQEAPTAEPQAPVEPAAPGAADQTWLPASVAAEAPETVAPTPEPPAPKPPSPPPAPEPPPPPAAAQPPPPAQQPGRARRRSGGLIGAARRVATRRH